MLRTTSATSDDIADIEPAADPAAGSVSGSDTLHVQLDAFLRRRQKRLLGMLIVAVNDEAVAMDILQDSMLAFVQRYARRKPAAQWPALLHRITQNKLRDHFRRNRVASGVVTTARSQPGPQPMYDRIDLAIDTQPDIQQQLDHQQQMQHLHTALKSLPLRQQQTFLLRAWEGLSEAETATAMRISRGSVKAHYARARASLRQVLSSPLPDTARADYSNNNWEAS